MFKSSVPPCVPASEIQGFRMLLYQMAMPFKRMWPYIGASKCLFS